jgi:drug/metabolite transporter (DMT)-like permease
VTRDQSRLAYAAWITICLVWGTTYLGIRVALETFPPALLGGIRFTIAGSLLTMWLALRGRPLPPLRHWPALAIAGTLLLAVGNGFVVFAEQWVPSGIAAVMVASAPFWMAGMEAMARGGEPLTARTATGLCVGFGGIVLLVWPNITAPAGAGHTFLIGIMALQAACLGWSAGSTYTKRYAPATDALTASALQMLFGGLVMLALGTTIGEWSRITLTVRSATAEVYLIVVGSWIGYSAYVYALQHLPVSTVSMYAYVNPVIAVLLGTWLLDEPFGMRVVIASAMVLAGIAIVRSARGEIRVGFAGGPRKARREVIT